MVSKINLLAAAGKLALDKLDCKSPSSYYAPMMNEEPWELPLVNEGEGPPISLADIQRAREEDQDHPL